MQRLECCRRVGASDVLRVGRRSDGESGEGSGCHGSVGPRMGMFEQDGCAPLHVYSRDNKTRGLLCRCALRPSAG